MKPIIIGFVIFLLLVSLIINIIFVIRNTKRYIDIFDNNVMDKLLNFNYDLLKIKRKIQMGTGVRIHAPKEIPLEMEYNHGIFLCVSDYIEVYGIKNKNEYLIYKMVWSKDDAKNIKDKVDEINKNLSFQS
jgi:energy-converting hydrogenase Eha subunit H